MNWPLPIFLFISLLAAFLSHLWARRQKKLQDLIHTQLQLVVEKSSQAVAVLDRNMCYRLVSQQWLNAYGVGEPNVIGRSHYEIFPEIPQRWKDYHKRALSGETIRQSNDRFDREDGSVQWVDWEIQPWKNSKGRVEGIIIFAEDITEKKKAAEELQKQIEKMRTLFEASNIGIVVGNHEGAIKDANEFYLKMLGYTRDELVKGEIRWDKLTPPEYLFLDRKAIAEAFSTGRSQIYEKPKIRKDGSEVWVVMGLARFDKDDIVAFVVDITKQKRVEQDLFQSRESLAQNEQTLRTMVEQLPVGIIVVEAPSGRVLIENQAFVGIFRHQSPSREKSYHGWTGFHTNGQPYLPEEWPIARSVGKGEIITGEIIRIRRGDGTLADISVNSSPIRNSRGVIISAVSAVTDVTDIKNIESQLRMDVKSRDELISVASHELKTPLTSLGLQTQFIERDLNLGEHNVYTAERIKTLTALTRKQVYRLTRLVDDLMDVGRIGSGNLTLDLNPMDLNELVKDVLGRIKAQFIESGCPIPELLSDGPVEGWWDRGRLEQVIDNLLTNALRYGDMKPVTVRLNCSETRARILVEDNGIGIPDDEKGKIFHRFGRATNSNKNGLGLGLFITQEIVHQHGGKIWLESKVGKGSTFFVELPRRAPRMEEPYKSNPLYLIHNQEAQ